MIILKHDSEFLREYNLEISRNPQLFKDVKMPRFRRGVINISKYEHKLIEIRISVSKESNSELFELILISSILITYPLFMVIAILNTGL